MEKLTKVLNGMQVESKDMAEIMLGLKENEITEYDILGIIEYCDFDSVDYILEFIDQYGADDFEINGCRFIHKNSIDEIQADELASDLYVLGCFNPEFIAGILGIDSDVIKIMQDKDCYEAIGRLVINMDMLDTLQSEYCRADGYGHHFNGYDFSELEAADYYIFNNRN